MDFVIFGNSKIPDLSFTIEPQRGGLFSISCTNNYVLYGGDEEYTNTIDWWFLVMNTSPDLAPHTTYPDWTKARSCLQDKLLSIAQTQGERIFLQTYLEESKAQYPALIPQTWVNWIHYNPHDVERARRVKSEPFRVDFTMYYDSRKIVIEVDGSSHFSDILDVDTSSGRIVLEGSMSKYTEHLRKDRWLRSKGWEVWRFSEQEILEKGFNMADTLREIGVLVRSR